MTVSIGRFALEYRPSDNAVANHSRPQNTRISSERVTTPASAQKLKTHAGAERKKIDVTAAAT